MSCLLLDLPIEILVKIFSYVGFNYNLYIELRKKNTTLKRVFSLLPYHDRLVTLDHGHCGLSERELKEAKMFRYTNFRLTCIEKLPEIEFYPDQHLEVINSYNSYNAGLAKLFGNLGLLKIPVSPTLCYIDLSDMENLKHLCLTWVTECHVEGGCDIKYCNHRSEPTTIFLPSNIESLTLEDVNFSKVNQDIFESCDKVTKLSLYKPSNLKQEILGDLKYTITELKVNQTSMPVDNFLSMFPNLVSLSWINEKVFDFNSGHAKFTNLDMRTLYQRFQNLRSLTLHGAIFNRQEILHFPPNLTELTLVSVALVPMVFPSSLRYLKIDNNVCNDFYRTNKPNVVSRYIRSLSVCTNLEHCYLTGVPKVSDLKEGLKNSLHTLKTLDVTMVTSIYTKKFGYHPKYATNQFHFTAGLPF